jgi:signal transduction histidine kinase
MNSLFRSSGAAKLIASQSRQIWLRVGGPIAVLILTVMAGAFFVLNDFARSEDRDWRQSSRELALGAIAGAQRAAAASVVDFAYWNQAYQAITRRWDEKWLESDMYSASADALVVYRPGKAVRYSWFKQAKPGSENGLAALVSLKVSEPAVIRQLVEDMRRGNAYIERFAAVDGQLAVIAAAPVSLETAQQRSAPDFPAPRDFLAVVDFVTPNELAQIGETLNLQDMRFTAASIGRPTPQDFVALQIRNPSGEVVGALEWRDERPGAARLAHRIWGAAILLLSIGIIAAFVARTLIARHVDYLAKAEMNAEVTRMKSQFIATMGHALRTPLDAVIGYAELMKEFIDEDSSIAREVRSDANRINESARQLMRVVNEILDYAKLETGDVPLRTESLAVTYVLDQILDSAKPKAAARGNQFAVAVEEPLLTVSADHARLAQCLMALVDHANRFTEDGRIVVSVRPYTLRGKSSIAFEVRDSGVGMNEEALARLFTPFAQWVDLAGYYYQADAGLGLSTARRLAVAMGGDILAASTQGKGSTLTLVLPAATELQKAA